MKTSGDKYKTTSIKMKSETAGVPIDWIMTIAELPADKALIRRLAPWLISLDLPFQLIDEVALLCRVSSTNMCYETYGTVTSAGTADFDRLQGLKREAKSWKIRAQHRDRLAKMTFEHERLLDCKISLEEVFKLDESFHWKRAKGNCKSPDGLDIVMVWTQFHGDRGSGRWLDISFSFDKPFKHVYEPKPQPAPVEGVTPLTGSSRSKKAKRYKAKRKERAVQAARHVEANEEREPGAPEVPAKPVGEPCSGWCEAQPGAQ